MPQVRVFSTQTCPYCVTLKEFLKDKNVSFKDIDVSFDAEAQKEIVEKTGQMGVPVIDIEGELIVGFDKEKIKKALGI